MRRCAFADVLASESRFVVSFNVGHCLYTKEILVDALYVIGPPDGASRLLKLRSLKAIFCATPQDAVGAAELALAQRESGAPYAPIVCGNDETFRAANASSAICRVSPPLAMSYEDDVMTFNDGALRVHGKDIALQDGDLIIGDDRFPLKDCARVPPTADKRRRFFGGLPSLKTSPGRRIFLIPDLYVQENPDLPPDKEEEEEVLTTDMGKELMFLGTGASGASKTRSEAAVLWSDRYLLDCGAGTLDRLKQECGGVPKLEVIWISHHHWDHCGGLVAVVDAVATTRKRPRTNAEAARALRGQQLPTRERPQGVLTVVGPAAVLEFLTACTDASFDAVPLQGPRHRHRHDSVDFTSVRVDHCKDAYAVIATSPTTIIAYSGDCRPSEVFAAAMTHAPRRGKLILVHEATFSDAHHAHALEKRHSTFSEAIQVAVNANADALVLTHFSPRYYGTLPSFESCCGVPIIAAFDGLCVDPNRIDALATASARCEKILLDRETSQNDDDDNTVKRRRLDDTDRGLRLVPPHFAFDDDIVPAAPLPTAPTCLLERRLVSFYEQYAPDRLGDVPKLLPLFRRNFVAMNAKLERKYNASLEADDLEGHPPPSSSSSASSDSDSE